MKTINLLIKVTLLASLILSVGACSSYTYNSQVAIDEPLINASGETLDGTPVDFPKDFAGRPTILLFGYVHKSQFDIDRWLIGLSMTKTEAPIYELPAIKNPIARLFSDRFDDAMREGIPREIWSDVITIYADGDKVQRYTGNVKPKNARVFVIDENGVVKYFYDRGFSVAALTELKDTLSAIGAK